MVPQGELAWIERIRQRAAIAARGSGALRLGIGDDCAILAPPRGHEIVVTTDMSLEGRHFRRDWHPPAAVGHRALARGLSRPRRHGRPSARGLPLARHPPRRRHGGHLGRRLPRRPPGPGRRHQDPARRRRHRRSRLLRHHHRHRPPRRHAHRPRPPPHRRPARRPHLRHRGPRWLRRRARIAFHAPAKRESIKPIKSPNHNGDHPHLFPQPRLAAGQSILRRRLATACIDLSRRPLHRSRAPLHRLQRCRRDRTRKTPAPPTHPLSDTDAALHSALHGGEDYELLFTAPPSASVPRAIAGVPLTCIGEIRRAGRNRPLMTLITPDGTRTPLEPGGWEHLR